MKRKEYIAPQTFRMMTVLSNFGAVLVKLPSCVDFSFILWFRTHLMLSNAGQERTINFHSIIHLTNYYGRIQTKLVDFSLMNSVEVYSSFLKLSLEKGIFIFGNFCSVLTLE